MWLTNNNEHKSQKREIIHSCVLFSIIAVVVFWLSDNIMRVSDDYVYQFVLEKDNYLFTKGFDSAKEINSITDVLRSQIVHYMTVNGRFVVHLIAQIFLGLLDQATFSIFNACAYIVLILLIQKLSNYTGFESRLVVSSLVLLGLGTIYFVTFQTNYIWMAALTCLWLCAYFNVNKKWENKYLQPFLFFFSIIAGNGQETYNIGICGALVVHHLTHFNQINRKQWVMFFGFGIGAMLLCMSPGTLQRSQEWIVPLYASLYKIITEPLIIQYLVNFRVND